MNLGDFSDVPTLSCLNKSQKRALILRDQLRYLEPAHLDTFLNGVTADEPPTYKHINGATYPPLAQVTVKEEATCFDLGNVQFSEGDGKTYRAYLTVEGGRFEMRTEDALPKDDTDLASVSIHRFVAENMFPLFKAKYKAIHARMEKMNEARRVAYNMLDHPPARFEDGETLSRLFLKSKAPDGSLQDGSSRKRREITKHISNKRRRVGLETISDNVKSDTFNTIPTQVKVDLFNNIVKTAFPNFEDLITASWNVVSVYANVGSDFPAFHKVILELKSTLEEFERSYASPHTQAGKSRRETTSNQKTSEGGSCISTPSSESPGTPVPTARSNTIEASQSQDISAAEVLKDPEEQGSTQAQKSAPPPLEASNGIQEDDVKQDERQYDCPSPPAPSRAHSLTRPAADHSPPAARPSYTSTSPPAIQHLKGYQGTRVRSTQKAPGAELMRKRQEYTASLTKMNRRVEESAAGQGDQGSEEEEGSDDVWGRMKFRAAGRGVAVPKTLGKVPAAPMLGTRRDNGADGEVGCAARKEW